MRGPTPRKKRARKAAPRLPAQRYASWSAALNTTKLPANSAWSSHLVEFQHENAGDTTKEKSYRVVDPLRGNSSHNFEGNSLNIMKVRIRGMLYSPSLSGSDSTLRLTCPDHIFRVVVVWTDEDLTDQSKLNEAADQVFETFPTGTEQNHNYHPILDFRSESHLSKFKILKDQTFHLRGRNSIQSLTATGSAVLAGQGEYFNWLLDFSKDPLVMTGETYDNAGTPDFRWTRGTMFMMMRYHNFEHGSNYQGYLSAQVKCQFEP